MDLLNLSGDAGLIEELIQDGAIFYCSHSGGKDSQAMYAQLRRLVPFEQLVVVHSDLGAVEWRGVKDHINDTIAHTLNVVQANKSFFDMVKHRAKTRPDVPSWPSSGQRQCTSDLKRNPIYKFIRNDLKAKGALLAINCTGLRAEESTARSKKQPLTVNNTLSKAGRTVFEWLPIHHWTTDEVFALIREVGQRPFWAYEAGNKRLSCVFCIMGCASDLANGKKHNPELYAQYVELEQETGSTMFNGESLDERIAKAGTDDAPEPQSIGIDLAEQPKEAQND